MGQAENGSPSAAVEAPTPRRVTYKQIAASAQELAGNAEELNRLVAQFKVAQG
jgi:methyl-accepting chemotaxis protein